MACLNTTALAFSANTQVGGWTFNAGASAYTFTNNQVLTFVGAGIIGGSATITNTLTGFLNFTSNSTAGNATITDNGNLYFILNSTAANAAITNARHRSYTTSEDTTRPGNRPPHRPR